MPGKWVDMRNPGMPANVVELIHAFFIKAFRVTLKPNPFSTPRPIGCVAPVPGAKIT